MYMKMVHNHYQKYTMKQIKYQKKKPINYRLYVLSLQNKFVKTNYMYMNIHKRKTLINTDTLIITLQ